MKILSIVSQKGGVGKTTLATCLAVEAERSGRSVALIALDPQNTATDWHDIRGKDTTPSVITVDSRGIDRTLEFCRANGIDLAIIDGAAVARDVAQAAIRSADFVLIPSKPALFDALGMKHAIHLAREQGAAHAIVLTFVPAQGREAADMAEVIETIGAPLCPVTIGIRKAFFRAQGEGKAAQEYEPLGAAANEVRQLYAYVEGLLFKPKRARRSRATSQEALA